LTCVYFNLNRDILGHVRALRVPEEFSNKQDNYGNKIEGKFLATLKIRGDEFFGSTDEETGLPTLIRFAHSGIYLTKATRQWLFQLRQEVAVMEDVTSAEFQQLATICNVLSNCPAV
jgi:hypothetical protein